MSYSPHYSQEVIWVSEYLDNTLLREWEDSGKEHSFNEIEKSKLKKFHLVSSNFDYYFDTSNGIFVIDGVKYVFPLAGLDLKFGEGLIHFKDATTEFVAAHKKTSNYTGFEINGYQMGWKVTHDNIKSQVIFNIPEKRFDVDLTFLNEQKTINWSLKI